MNATCSEINGPIMATAGLDRQPRPTGRNLDRNLDPADTFLYQAATVLAILLFLVSF